VAIEEMPRRGWAIGDVGGEAEDGFIERRIVPRAT